MQVKVKQLIGEPQDITLKDGTVIKKQLFLAEDNKTYATFANIQAGQEYDGTVEHDTRSGELRFKKTKVPFTPRGGGGESNRQTALKAASVVYSGASGKLVATELDSVLSTAERFLKWLEAGGASQAGSQGNQGTPPVASSKGSDASGQNPAQPEQVPIEAYEGL